MSDLQFIEKTLAQAAQRRRVERALRGFWQGLFVGVIICIIALAVYKLAPVPRWTLAAAATAGIVSAITGLIIGGWRKTSLPEMARWVDVRENLQERLSTALELSKTDASGFQNWKELIVTDAASHAKDIDPRKLVKFRMPAVSRWALALVALAVGLGFVPEYRSKAYLQKKSDDQIIKEAGQKLVELTKQSLKQRPPVMETTQKAMDAVGELGDQLSKKPMTRSEALKDLAKVSDQLKDQMGEMGKDPALKRLEQAARSKGGDTTPEMARLQKQIADTQKQLGDPTGSPEDMDKLNKELNKLSEAAKAAADKNNGKLSDADKQNLSKSLAALSKQAQEMGMQTPNLDHAMDALAANQTDMMLKDLQQATFDLEKTKEMAKSLQQMQQQMDKLGKNLGEQLKNGQPEEAQNTLQKMIDQLKSSKLSQEQLAKISDEVSKALDPASKYGKVSDHLKSALEKMQQGQKPQAAESLAAASKELDKLMQEMGDAQSLSAELDALNKAQLSVGTCQSWGNGQCNKPGLGKGGKPGKGVGQWADDEAGWGFQPQMTDHWDNTGAVRPDAKPRGLTDRGDPELNDALTPTKVKGQFTPGGQMPSITLKGVSIKGQSKVAFEEAAVAAQADAQSALSQEKVPRAYQGSVKDYFDDLKK
jgi:hypothetical protein